MTNTSLQTEFLELLTSQGLTLIREVSHQRGATVSLVQDLSGGKLAIKVIDTRVELPHHPYLPLKVIEQEISILGSFHPTLSDLYVKDGWTGPLRWLLMKWIEGVSLGTIFKELRLTRQVRKKGLPLIKKAVESVNALHQVGYTHGDLQPSHFIVTPEEAVVLIDFGLCRKEKDEQYPYEGALASLNSPELCRKLLAKESGLVHDRVSEIYTLGAVLFCLWTGSTPTDISGSAEKGYASYEEILSRVAHDPLRNFLEVGGEPFPELEDLLHRCLTKDPATRCPSAEKLLQEITVLS